MYPAIGLLAMSLTCFLSSSLLAYFEADDHSSSTNDYRASSWHKRASRRACETSLPIAIYPARAASAIRSRSGHDQIALGPILPFHVAEVPGLHITVKHRNYYKSDQHASASASRKVMNAETYPLA